MGLNENEQNFDIYKDLFTHQSQLCAVASKLLVKGEGVRGGGQPCNFTYKNQLAIDDAMHMTGVKTFAGRRQVKLPLGMLFTS